MATDAIRVCVAGITGSTGSAVAQAIAASPDLRLQTGVSRSASGRDSGSAAGGPPSGTPVFRSVDEALHDVDVLVDYTSHEVVRSHVESALDRGVAVVIGSSGLTAQDLAEIDQRAQSRGLGVIAAGNFSLTAALAQACALLAAQFLPDYEIIDYASSRKPDSPSGTARELAERLGELRQHNPDAESSSAVAPSGARGLAVSDTRVHSLRINSYHLFTEVVFGLPQERLTIRHDTGDSAEPYVAGTLLAIRAVPKTIGLIRGLDRLLANATEPLSLNPMNPP